MDALDLASPCWISSPMAFTRLKGIWFGLACCLATRFILTLAPPVVFFVFEYLHSGSRLLLL